MISSCLLKLRRHYHSFPPKVRIVADYIIEHPNEVLSSSINELADKTGVSQYSVLNCVRQIGFKGYSDFKITMALESKTPEDNNRAPGSDSMPAYTTLESVLKRNSRLLDETLQLVEPADLAKVVGHILHADRILIYGIGFSSYAAQYLSLQLVQFGLKASVITDPMRQILESSTLTETDLLIGFSCSGNSSEITEAFEIAKMNQCTTIAISSNRSSPLAFTATLGLYTTASTPPYPKGINNAIIEQISLSTAIAAAVYNARKELTQ